MSACRSRGVPRWGVGARAHWLHIRSQRSGRRRGSWGDTRSRSGASGGLQRAVRETTSHGHPRPHFGPASALARFPVSKSNLGPAGVTPGEDGGIGSHPLPSPGGRARSPWSTSRARTRGLSIVLGSPPPSAGSSPGSGRRGPPCRRSRWSGCHCGWPSPDEPVRPDSPLRGRVSSSLTSSDN